MRITAKTQLNKLYDVSGIVKAIRKEAERFKEPVQNDFKSTVKHFKKKPTFKAFLAYRGGDFILSCKPSGNRKAVQIWHWLNFGTRTRHAVMSKDYKPSTIPNTIRTRAGKGRVLHVSKRIKQKGIEARNWTTVIQRRNGPPFRGAVTRAMREAIRKRK